MTTWCPTCLVHEVDPKNHQPTCPVCVDRARLAAEAKVLAMGWGIRQGGRA